MVQKTSPGLGLDSKNQNRHPEAQKNSERERKRQLRSDPRQRPHCAASDFTAQAPAKLSERRMKAVAPKKENQHSACAAQRIIGDASGSDPRARIWYKEKLSNFMLEFFFCRRLNSICFKRNPWVLHTASAALRREWCENPHGLHQVMSRRSWTSLRHTLVLSCQCSSFLLH